MSELEFAATTNDVDAARDLAQQIKGSLYVDDRPEAKRLPFRALVTGVTDDFGPFASVGEVGTYVICRRLIKPGSPTVIGLFPMTRHPQKSHTECDAHWRDVHGPLALEHHAYMSHYSQLSVVHTLSGTPVDGFALCGFASLEDLRERFFTTDASVAVIQQDIQNFADTKNSARRLIATPSFFS